MAESVRKAVAVLGLFSVERPDWGPSEVASELQIAKSTAHSLLVELTRAGLTERLPCGRYRLGWRTVGLARTTLATSWEREAAGPFARRLSVHFGETVYIAMRAGSDVVYLAVNRPPGGMPAPVESSVADGSPLWRVLFGSRRTGLDERGYVLGAPSMLEGATCAVASADARSAVALCAASERVAVRGEEYGRAAAGIAARLAAVVRR